MVPSTTKTDLPHVGPGEAGHTCLRSLPALLPGTRQRPAEPLHLMRPKIPGRLLLGARETSTNVRPAARGTGGSWLQTKTDLGPVSLGGGDEAQA